MRLHYTPRCWLSGLAGRLFRPAWFELTRFDVQDTSNLWARIDFSPTGPHLMFAGHTDVVPSGPVSDWDNDPFTPLIADGYLYGRGAADMKSSLAAMLVASKRLCAANQTTPYHGSLSLLITSDEEGAATYGTQYAIQQLAARGIRPDYCIVGEPSSSTQVGDVVRCGRRGSINANLTVRGVQGHVAYPQDASNPIHAALPALQALTEFQWDQGNKYYPPTSLQISNLNAGTGATNVIPGRLELALNLRFNTEQSARGIQAKVDEILHPFGLDYELQWQLSGLPFLTEPGVLTQAVTQAVSAEMGHPPEFSTSGGTSDGRFIAPGPSCLQVTPTRKRWK